MAAYRSLDPWTSLRLQRGSVHLVRLGPRALAEYLSELAGQIGGLPAALALLAEYERRLTPDMLRATGGDRQEIVRESHHLRDHRGARALAADDPGRAR